MIIIQDLDSIHMECMVTDQLSLWAPNLPIKMTAGSQLQEHINLTFHPSKEILRLDSSAAAIDQTLLQESMDQDLAPTTSTTELKTLQASRSETQKLFLKAFG